MGAGLAGLAAAITLEKHGISPDIYEKRNCPGDRFVNGEIILSALNRPVVDSLKYLSEKHGIYLLPVSNITKMIIYSSAEKAVIEGELGYINLRGRHEHSFEKQLATQVKGKIKFNSDQSYEELINQYTHVLMATGDAAYSLKLNNYRKDLAVTLKGATVTGTFNSSTVCTWLDYSLAPLGYGYLIPFSEKEANVVLAYPDYRKNREKDLNRLWEKYFQRVGNDIKQELKVTDRFEITRYIIGICKNPRIDNTFFVGNCFGAIMPFLGFGQFPSILSGVYAAHDLCGRGNYEQLVKPLRKSYDNSLVLRRLLEALDNKKLNLLVRGMKGRVGSLVFNSRRVNLLGLMGNLMRIIPVKKRPGN
ncbi:MAG: FAD-dependent oxidoreductase [Halanaerobiaceae bacterium]